MDIRRYKPSELKTSEGDMVLFVYESSCNNPIDSFRRLSVVYEHIDQINERCEARIAYVSIEGLVSKNETAPFIIPRKIFVVMTPLQLLNYGWELIPDVHDKVIIKKSNQSTTWFRMPLNGCLGSLWQKQKCGVAQEIHAPLKCQSALKSQTISNESHHKIFEKKRIKGENHASVSYCSNS